MVSALHRLELEYRFFHIPFNFSVLGGKGDRELRILIGTQCALAWEIVMKTGNSIEESGNLHSSYFA